MTASRVRAIHRISTLIIGAQLVIWTATGFAFSWFDFARVRGTDDRAPAAAISGGEVRVGIAEAIAASGSKATSVELGMLLDRPVYAIARADGTTVLVDAVDGKSMGPIGLEQASAIARAAYRGRVGVISAEQVTGVPDLDGQVWRVRLDDALDTEVFVSPRTGAVLAWRNASWRWFDRLWSLHVLGWASRDNPAHLAMRVGGSLAVIAAMSGVWLLVTTFRKRRHSTEPRA